MSFDVAAEAYGLFMGRYSEPLAVRFTASLDLRGDERALDVGCGPGALTAVLVEGRGPGAVWAGDPWAPFGAAARSRFPDVDVRRAAAETLPYGDATFDVAAAQLVVHFMADPVAGLAEMARVVRPGGQVAACVWDHAGGGGPLSLFWRAVHDLDPTARDGSNLAGAREGHLAELFGRAGLRDIRSDRLSIETRFATAEDWWHPYTLGVGPAGAYVASLDPAHRDALRRHCETLLPPLPVTVTASAWTAHART